MLDLLKQQLKGLLAGGVYFTCNYIVAYIPSWTIRKAIYRLLGMKIGKYSRIMMRVVVTHPWKIEIGENSVINEYCYLDGRGGISIANNVNVALYSMLITGTHDHTRRDFNYYTQPIVIEDDVWIAARSVVLNGCVLRRGVLLSAGAVLPPGTKTKECIIYAGVPAKGIKRREVELPLVIEHWRIHIR